MKSIQKGNKGEREVANMFKREGIEAKRVPRSGAPSYDNGSKIWVGDIWFPKNRNNFAIEVKLNNKWSGKITDLINPNSWIRKVFADLLKKCKDHNKIPILIFRRNHDTWLAMYIEEDILISVNPEDWEKEISSSFNIILKYKVKDNLWVSVSTAEFLVKYISYIMKNHPLISQE